MECPICLGIDTLVYPPINTNCTHGLCKRCWVTIGEKNPTCPYCRRDLREWMESIGVKVNSKERFGFDDFSNSSLTLQSARVQVREYLQTNNISGTGYMTVNDNESFFTIQYNILDNGEILLVTENSLDEMSDSNYDSDSNMTATVLKIPILKRLTIRKNNRREEV